MSTQTISAPTALAVSMAQAKETLRIDADDSSLDSTIAIWVRGITATTEHITGRAFINRPMLATFGGFNGAIDLGAPTFSVEQVLYMDASGEMQLMEASDYYLDRASSPASLLPARGKRWPVTDAHVNAVTVEYTAGYGATDADVPDEAKLYILGRLSELFDPAAREFRETQASVFLDKLLEGLIVYAK